MVIAAPVDADDDDDKEIIMSYRSEKSTEMFGCYIKMTPNSKRYSVPPIYLQH